MFAFSVSPTTFALAFVSFVSGLKFPRSSVVNKVLYGMAYRQIRGGHLVAARAGRPKGQGTKCKNGSYTQPEKHQHLGRVWNRKYKKQGRGLQVSNVGPFLHSVNMELQQAAQGFKQNKRIRRKRFLKFYDFVHRGTHEEVLILCCQRCLVRALVKCSRPIRSAGSLCQVWAESPI